MCVQQEPLVSFILGVHLVSSFIPFSFLFSFQHSIIESKGVSQAWTGIIVGGTSYSSFLISWYFHHFVHKFGRTCSYLFGFYFTTAFFLLLGLASLVENKVAFVVLSLTLRILQGVGLFITKSVILSIGAKRYPSKINNFNSFIFNAINLGLGIGPLLGTVLFKLFEQNFFYCSLIVVIFNLLIFAPLGHCMLREPKPKIPRTLSPTQSKIAQAESKESAQRMGLKRVETKRHEKTVPICQALCSSHTISMMVVLFLYIFCQIYWVSSVSIELEERYNKSTAYIGFFMLVRTLGALVTTFTVPLVVRCLGRVLTLFMAAMVQFLAFIFVGPSLMFGLPASAEIIMLGVALKGLLDPFLFIPVIPEMIEHFRNKHANQYFIGPVGDVMSSLANVIIDAAVIIASFCGHMAFESLGFRQSSDLFLLLQLPLIAFVLIFGGVIPEFRKKCRREKHEEKSVAMDVPASERPFNFQEIGQESPTHKQATQNGGGAEEKSAQD